MESIPWMSNEYFSRKDALLGKEEGNRCSHGGNRRCEVVLVLGSCLASDVNSK